MTLAKVDTGKTLLFGIFIGCFFAAGTLASSLLIDVADVKILEKIDFGLILLFVSGICLIVGFILDGIHTSREIRRKNLLIQQKIRSLQEERQAPKMAEIKHRGASLLKPMFSTKDIIEDVEDYSEKITYNRGLILMVSGMFNLLLLVFFVFLS